MEIRAVFLDISKAFDKVWHNGLIFKLKQNGISGNLLKLYQNYVSNRKQCVILNGTYSDYSGIDTGNLKALFLVPYYFLFISMILKETLIPISSFLLMIPCYFL